jgi:hypothetical protein
MAKRENTAPETPKTEIPENKLPVLHPALQNLPSELDDFEDVTLGEVYGGTYDRMELTEGETTDYLVYVKKTTITTDDVGDDGQPKKNILDVHIGMDRNGNQWALPIGAIIWNHFKEANLNPGDVFRIKRYEDVTKKQGRGAGKPMQAYALKVYSRNLAN